MMRLIPFLCAAVLLAGCSLTSTAVGQLNAVTVADLNNALAKAQSAGDKSGQLCWQALQALPSPQGATIGVATLLEDQRIVNQALAGPCSVLVHVP
jgi:hypothetical protein